MNYTTEQLAEATGVARELILEMLDAGLFRNVAALREGKPVYGHHAISVIENARNLADRAAAGDVSPAQAWMELQGLKATR
jgi:hypothetical protein